MGARDLCTDGSVIPVSEGHAEALALACEDAQPLQPTRELAEVMAVRAAFYWQICAGWDGKS